MNAGALSLAVGLLFANAFFVAAEFALIGARRSRIDQLAASGDRRARLAGRLQADLSVQLAGAQLGITLASLALGTVAEPAVAAAIEMALDGVVELPESALQATGFAVGLAIVVLLHMVLGEMVPKSIAITHAETTLLWLAGPMRVVTFVLRPVLVSLNVLSNVGVRLLRIEPREELVAPSSPEELGAMFAASRDVGLLGDDVHALLGRALASASVTAADLVVPLPDVVSAPHDVPAAELAQRFARSRHPRIPIHGRDPAAIVGFVHVNDLLDLDVEAGRRPVARSLIRPMVRVSSSATVADMVLRMRQARTQVGVVTHPDGSTAGIVMLDDVLAPLVGGSSLGVVAEGRRLTLGDRPAVA
ncbi:MAG: hemolysin family protein [Actinomycetota bacterium]